MKHKVGLILVLGLLLATVVACTGGPNPLEGTAVPGADEPAGFVDGFIHGAFVGIIFIISLFDESVRIYEVHNVGLMYDLGFVIGSGVLFGGILGSRRR